MWEKGKQSERAARSRRAGLALWAVALTGAAGCGAESSSMEIDDGSYRPAVELGRHRVQVLETRQVVPSAGLPPETVPLNSNNNLDVIRHAGRVYLAWRTSADHFAGPDTIIYVASSADEITWTYETEFSVGTDLREPRFLSVGDTLTLHLSLLGVDPNAFEPMGVHVSRRGPDGTWSALEELYGDDTLVWRTKTVPDGRHFMTAYNGGENIYNFSGDPLQIRFRTTTDGITWTDVDAAHPAVYEGGGSETAFAFADNGDLYAVIRAEADDALGLGSKICHAPAGDIGNWACVTDPKKYDSPYMFAYDGEVYLIGRRNVTPSGEYAEGGLSSAIVAQLRYIQSAKRCSLWRIVHEPGSGAEDGAPRVAYVLDLPSNGDTCFPGVIDGESDGEFIVYNYSSDPDAAPLSWRDGQLGPTQLYRHVLRFERR